MIPSATHEIRLAHQQALELPKSFDENDPEEQLRRKLWRTVFKAAEQIANQLNRASLVRFDDSTRPEQFPRDYDAQDIVNHWYLDIESDSQVSHDFRAHDRVTGFKTIGQELRELAEQENREAYETWEQYFREWYFGGKIGPKPILPKKVQYHLVKSEDLETFGTGAWSEQEDEVESEAALLARKQEFYQDAAEDAENMFEDNRGCKLLAIRYRKRGDFKFYRGSRGVLGGLYTNTDPEPSYRTPQARATLLRTLLRSDNVIDVKMAKGMNRKLTLDPMLLAKANASRS